VREGFQDELLEDIEDQGFDSTELAMVIYPDALSQSGSDLSAIAAGIDEIIDGLTK
jgi:hypothetical protein